MPRASKTHLRLQNSYTSESLERRRRKELAIAVKCHVRMRAALYLLLGGIGGAALAENKELVNMNFVFSCASGVVSFSVLVSLQSLRSCCQRYYMLCRYYSSPMSILCGY